METIADRIIQIVNTNGGNKSEFARRINVTPAYISKLSKEPNRIPSDRTISDICKEFGVNEGWLRTGVGEPFVEISREDQITLVLGKAINGTSTARDRLIRALARLPDDAFPLIEKFILETAEKLKEESTEAE